MDRQAAFVLHSRPYRETSQLVEVFCASGRVSLVARGSRRPRSPLRALLQPFMPIELAWQGQRGLKTLIAAEPLGTPIALREVALYSGLYLNELLYYLLEPDTTYPVLFSAYQQSLDWLARLEAPEPVLRQFELLLLDELGYGVDFSCDAHTGAAIEPDGVYLYLAECGFVRHTAERPTREGFRGSDLQAMACRHFSDVQQLQAAKRFCRLALHPHLGNRPLKSRELFQQLAVRRMQ